MRPALLDGPSTAGCPPAWWFGLRSNMPIAVSGSLQTGGSERATFRPCLGCLEGGEMEDFDVRPSSKGTVIVTGDLDVLSAPRFETVVAEVMSYCGNVVVDMTGLRFIDTSGLRSIIRVAVGLDGRGLIRLDNVAPNVMEVMRIVGLDAIPGIQLSERDPHTVWTA
jgi:anti-anti-sigma factor